jgi:hypothetical protein
MIRSWIAESRRRSGYLRRGRNYSVGSQIDVRLALLASARAVASRTFRLHASSSVPSAGAARDSRGYRARGYAAGCPGHPARGTALAASASGGRARGYAAGCRGASGSWPGVRRWLPQPAAAELAGTPPAAWGHPARGPGYGAGCPDQPRPSPRACRQLLAHACPWSGVRRSLPRPAAAELAGSRQLRGARARVVRGTELADHPCGGRARGDGAGCPGHAHPWSEV